MREKRFRLKPHFVMSVGAFLLISTIYASICLVTTTMNRSKQNIMPFNVAFPPEGANLENVGSCDSSMPMITGLSVELNSEYSSYVEVINYDVPTKFRLFGINLNTNTFVYFTAKKGRACSFCSLPATDYVQVSKVDADGRTGLITLTLSSALASSTFYICAKHGDPMHDSNTAHTSFLHQGTDSWKTIVAYSNWLPLYARLLIIAISLLMSALFSGLSLGLMSLDRIELEILCNAGTEKEQSYAKAVRPLRSTGNYLLCSILIANTLVNALLTTLLNTMFSSAMSVAIATGLIVFLGEIVPQAICSRKGLAVGAKTVFLTKIIMFLTAPISYPIGKLLDKLLGEELGTVYDRERLKEMFRVTTGRHGLADDELKIISGALELRRKRAVDIMTHISDVFMLDISTVLDFDVIANIMQSGYSRIPVYDGTRNNIVTILYTKDLAFVDPDSEIALLTHCKYFQNSCLFVNEDDTLDMILKLFREGEKGHMAIVRHKYIGDPDNKFQQVLGVVTLEDVIEEIIQMEIIDETDTVVDNRSKMIRRTARTKDFFEFTERPATTAVSQHLIWMAYQYLVTSVDAFHADVISPSILKRLLKRDVYYRAKGRGVPVHNIYTRGQPADYFILVLEGQVQVILDEERFMAGPFVPFGAQALQKIVPRTTSSNVDSVAKSSAIEDSVPKFFYPEYTVRPVKDVLYLKITRSSYVAALKATHLGKFEAHMDQPLAHDEEMMKLFTQLVVESTKSTSAEQVNVEELNNISEDASFVSAKDEFPPTFLDEV